MARYQSWADVPVDPEPPQSAAGVLRRIRPAWLLVAAGVVAVALVVTVVAGGDDEKPTPTDEVAGEPADGADAAPAASAPGPDHVLETPDLVANWGRADGLAADVTAEATEALAAAPAEVQDDLELVTAAYSGPEGEVVLQGYNVSGATQESLASDPLALLGNLFPGLEVGGFTSVDAGDLGGVMVCSDDAVPDAVLCGWADDTTIGRADWSVDDLDAMGAADLTHVLRDAVTAG